MPGSTNENNTDNSQTYKMQKNEDDHWLGAQRINEELNQWPSAMGCLDSCQRVKEASRITHPGAVATGNADFRCNSSSLI